MRLLTFLYDIWNKGLDIIYPASSGCPICGAYGGCSCSDEIICGFKTRKTCVRCGKFLSPGVVCLDCQSRGLGFPEPVVALAPYSGELRKAILEFKYRGNKRTGLYLAELLWEGPGRVVAKPDMIIPVPMHREKLRMRGFNQTVLLADYLGNKLAVKVVPGALERTISTQPQAELTKAERRENLVDAFYCPFPEKVRGKNILLVDDIITTGYTLEGCGVALRGAQASSITGICLASGTQER